MARTRARQLGRAVNLYNAQGFYLRGITAREADKLVEAGGASFSADGVQMNFLQRDQSQVIPGYELTLAVAGLKHSPALVDWFRSAFSERLSA